MSDKQPYNTLQKPYPQSKNSATVLTSNSSKNKFIEIAKITSPHGIKGEVKIFLYTTIDNIKNYTNFYLGKSKKNIKFKLKSIKNDSLIVISISDIEDRNTAESLRNQSIFIKDTNLTKINEKDVFYNHHLINLNVIDKKGLTIGRVIDVVNHGAGDNIIIQLNDNKVIEEPFLKIVFPEINFKKGTITFIPMEII